LQFQELRTEPSGHHTQCAVIFEPIALKPLNGQVLVLDALDRQRGNRVAKHREATMPFPKGANRSSDTVPRFGKAALVMLSVGRCGHEWHKRNEMHTNEQQSAEWLS